MASNFEHMKEWDSIYQKLLFMEKLMLNEVSTENSIQAMSSARGALDILMKELMNEAHISDDEVIAVKRKMAAGSRDAGKVDLFGRILAAEKLGIISAESAQNLHFIRSVGNKAVHGEESMLKSSDTALYAQASQVYEKLYRETYLFVKQYVPEVRANPGKKNKIMADNAPPNILGSTIIISIIFYFAMGILLFWIEESGEAYAIFGSDGTEVLEVVIVAGMILYTIVLIVQTVKLRRSKEPRG